MRRKTSSGFGGGGLVLVLFGSVLMLIPNDVGELSPMLSEINFPEFRNAFRAEMTITFAWTSAEGIVESEGPLLAERVWNPICLG